MRWVGHVARMRQVEIVVSKGEEKWALVLLNVDCDTKVTLK
jgi:hypothetical protein